MPQGERLVRLNRIAIQQMSVLEDGNGDDYKWGHALFLALCVCCERNGYALRKVVKTAAMYTNKNGALSAPRCKSRKARA